jgi:hypothetical protein
MKILLLIVFLSFVSCNKDVVDCRTICNDGTKSTSRGSGACSYHGGIRSQGCSVPEAGKNY